MKIFRRFLPSLLCGLMALCGSAAVSQPVRVACVGNSITYGAGIADHVHDTYPAQLQALLGPAYEVRNFGVSATTLLSKGNYPYVTTQAYTDSRSFAPDIVFIKLGTNDTKPYNWVHRADFEKDYQALIDSYRSLPSHPRIILLTPLRCYLAEGEEISSRLIATEVRTLVKRLAKTNGLECIDMHRVIKGKWDAALMPDRLHPSAQGAGMMARHLANYLKHHKNGPKR